ncbi:MAG: hypothetical protein ACQEQU_07090 [Spirochaetota bacterium]
MLTRHPTEESSKILRYRVPQENIPSAVLQVVADIDDKDNTVLYQDRVGWP